MFERLEDNLRLEQERISHDYTLREFRKLIRIPIIQLVNLIFLFRFLIGIRICFFSLCSRLFPSEINGKGMSS